MNSRGKEGESLNTGYKAVIPESHEYSTPEKQLLAEHFLGRRPPACSPPPKDVAVSTWPAPRLTLLAHICPNAATWRAWKVSQGFLPSSSCKRQSKPNYGNLVAWIMLKIILFSLTVPTHRLKQISRTASIEVSYKPSALVMRCNKFLPGCCIEHEHACCSRYRTPSFFGNVHSIRKLENKFKFYQQLL